MPCRVAPSGPDVEQLPPGRAKLYGQDPQAFGSTPCRLPERNSPFGPDGRIESSARLKNRRSDRHIRPPDAICRDRSFFQEGSVIA